MKGYFERRRLLKQQMELLSEESKRPLPGNEKDYAYAMSAINKELSRIDFTFLLFLLARIFHLLLYNTCHKNPQALNLMYYFFEHIAKQADHKYSFP